jgi:hypothetical protein
MVTDVLVSSYLPTILLTKTYYKLYSEKFSTVAYIFLMGKKIQREEKMGE